MTLTPFWIRKIEERLVRVLDDFDGPDRAYGSVSIIVERGRIVGVTCLTSQRQLAEMLDRPP